MYCTYCGQQNGKSNKFCENCGKPMNEKASPSHSSQTTKGPKQENQSKRSASKGSSNKQDGSKTNNNSNNLFVILGVAVLLLLCAGILVVVPKIFSKTKSLITNDEVTPSHFGVFVKQGGDLIELEERESFNIPTAGDFNNLEAVTDSQPTFVIYRNNTNLDYLIFYMLGEHIGESSEIKYIATPKNNGIIELSPSSPLENGEYCLTQGDPAAISIPWWCFRIGSTEGNIRPGTSPIVSSEAVRSWKEGVQIEKSFEYTEHIKWGVDSKYLIICKDWIGSLYIINFDILKQKSTVNSIPQATCLSISNNEKDILVYDHEEKANKIYNSKSKHKSPLPTTFPNNWEPYSLTTFSPTENTIAYVQREDTKNTKSIKIWDLNSNKEIYSWTIEDSYINAMTFSKNGNLLGVVGSKDNCRYLKVFDLRTGSELQSFNDHSCIESIEWKVNRYINNLYPTSIDFSYDNKLIAVGYLDTYLTMPGVSQVAIWDVQTGELVSQLKGNSSIPLEEKKYRGGNVDGGGVGADYFGGVVQIAFSPDGKVISGLAMEDNQNIKIYFWGLSSGEVINEINEPASPSIHWEVFSASEIGFSPNGKYFFALDKIYGIK